MNAKLVTETDKHLLLEAVGEGLDQDGGSINVKVSSTCEHVADDLKLLETATFAFFMKFLPRIVREDRESAVNQYLSRLDVLLNDALKRVEEETKNEG